MRTMNDSSSRRSLVLVAAFLALSAAGGCSTMGAKPNPGQTTYHTPEAAVAALAEIAGQHDAARVEQVFGPGATEVVFSGDDVADRERGLAVKELIDQKVAFEDLDEETKVALFGPDDWPFPIPLAKVRGGWQFDTEAGREEIANRRIGINELGVLSTLHAFVDAQREYRATQGRSRAYAQRVISSEGKRDGLYWPTPDGAPESPLGPLVADAAAEGYSTEAADEPRPYHGYLYRMLHGQGANAPGGAKSYLDAKGEMTGGFAMVAWPATYGNSGMMTFVVGAQGIVFQKDLGENTADEVANIQVFDPDASWSPTGD